jgi:hypothetical protein
VQGIPAKFTVVTGAFVWVFNIVGKDVEVVGEKCR